MSDLRQRAEEQLQAEAVITEEPSSIEATRLIHELRVHQIELEMQNEELRQAQVRLEESRSKYVDLYDFAPVGYLTLDDQGKIVEANLMASTLLGVERSSLLGRFFPLFLAEPDRLDFRRLLNNSMKQREWRGECHLQSGSGEVRTMLLDLLILKDAEGQERRRLTLADITELKQVQQNLEESQAKLRHLNQTLEQQVKERTLELEQAVRELESFSFSVAHDLKTPLRAIQGFSRMLLGEHTAELDAEGRRLFQVVVDNTQLISVHIDDILNLARMACQQIRKVSMDITGMATAVFARLQSQEPERDVRLIAKESPPAWGDSPLLYRVLTRLLENAFKFTKKNKTAVIEVGGRSEGRENIYYIKDNGVGFDEGYVHKMFGIFQRLHNGEEYEGAGVGLATVQRIIQRHGGRVWAEGKLNEGATFYFSLPKN